MEEEIKVDDKFKSAFNIGYRVAKELNLKTQILKGQENLMANNPIHMGMQQYIDEAKLSIHKRQDKSIKPNIQKNTKKRKGKGLGF